MPCHRSRRYMHSTKIKRKEEVQRQYKAQLAKSLESIKRSRTRQGLPQESRPPTTKRKQSLRARTAAEDGNPTRPCQKCSKTDQPERLVICYSCDEACHYGCMRPPRLQVPLIAWFYERCMIHGFQTADIDCGRSCTANIVIFARQRRATWTGTCGRCTEA